MKDSSLGAEQLDTLQQRTRPVIKDSIIIFSTCRRDDVSGSANYPPADTTFLECDRYRLFRARSEEEEKIRRLADALYRRVDWNWALHGGATVTHGWRPEGGFLRYRWESYDEALLLYILGLGSPTYSLPGERYRAWMSTCLWKNVYGHEFLYAGPPLFIHQLSHLWIDFRGIQDAFMLDNQTFL
jgi:hypothetical protein